MLFLKSFMICTVMSRLYRKLRSFVRASSSRQQREKFSDAAARRGTAGPKRSWSWFSKVRHQSLKVIGLSDEKT